MDIPAKESATSRQDIIITAYVCVCLMDQKHRAYL